MSKISIFVKIFNVTNGTTNTTIGLISGDLQWCSHSGFENYSSGMFDQNLIDIAPQSCNIAVGGCLGGFDGSTTLTAIDQTFRNSVYSGSIELLNKQITIHVGIDISSIDEAVLKYNGVISSFDYSDEIRTVITCDSSVSIDLKKIPSVEITKEMTLNNEDNDSIGENITPSYGRYVYYPLFYCDSSNKNISLSLSSNGNIVTDNSETLLYTTSPQLVNTLDLQFMSKNYTFFKGKTLFECVGLYQEGGDSSNVWIAISFNGYGIEGSALYNSDDFERIKNVLIGKKITCVKGTGSGTSIIITSVEFSEKDVIIYKSGDDIETKAITALWLQTDILDISKFSFSLKRDDSSDTNSYKKPINCPLTVTRKMIFADNLNLRKYMMINAITSPTTLQDKVSGDFSDSTSFFSFKSSNTGIFLVNVDADLSEFELYENVGEAEGFSFVSKPENVSVIYSSEKWKMISIEIKNTSSGDIGEFTQFSSEEIETYLIENIEDTTNNNLAEKGVNSVSIPEFGRFKDQLSGADISTRLTNIPKSTEPIDYLALGNLIAVVEGTPFHNISLNNAFYNYINGNDYKENSISFMPCIFTFFIKTDNVACKIDVSLIVSSYLIVEGNIVLDKKTSETNLIYDMWDGSTVLQEIEVKIDNINNQLLMSENCRSGTSSKEMYSTIIKAISFSMDDYEEQLYQITGILTNVEIVYKVADSQLLRDDISITKVVKTARVIRSKKANKEKLYLRCLKDNSVFSPVHIAKQVALENGLTVGDTFIEAFANQSNYIPVPNDFDGMYQPEADQSVSDVLDDIAKKSMTAIYQDAAGILQAKFLPSTPSSISHEFSSTDIKKDSMTFSMPKSGYLFSDYDFSVKKNIVCKESIISIDTDGTETFPADGDYKLGDILYSSNDYDFEKSTYMNFSGLDIIEIRIRGENDFLFANFIPGTNWHFITDTTQLRVTYTLTLDSVAEDFSCPVDKKGIRLGFRVLTRTSIEL